MQKFSTSTKKTDFTSKGKKAKKMSEMQPQNATIQKILQFASSYRAEKVADNQFVELFLN